MIIPTIPPAIAEQTTSSKKLKSNINALAKIEKLTNATNTAKELANDCMQLLEKFWVYGTPIRAIRICTYNLKNSKNAQLCMFSETTASIFKNSTKLNNEPPDTSNPPLLNAKWRANKKYNSLQISTSAKQIKNANLNNAVDKIRTKYGYSAIRPLSNLHN